MRELVGKGGLRSAPCYVVERVRELESEGIRE